MAWLETDRHGRLRIGFKYYDGLKCREPLGVSANRQTIAEARRLCATISHLRHKGQIALAKLYIDILRLAGVLSKSA